MSHLDHGTQLYIMIIFFFFFFLRDFIFKKTIKLYDNLSINKTIFSSLNVIYFKSIGVEVELFPLLSYNVHFYHGLSHNFASLSSLVNIDALQCFYATRFHFAMHA